jgi:hypothetical protein
LCLSTGASIVNIKKKKQNDTLKCFLLHFTLAKSLFKSSKLIWRNKSASIISREKDSSLSCLIVVLFEFLYVYLYLYSAGTDRGYKCTGRRAVGLVQLLEGTSKALYCLCAHYAILKVVPIDYSLWKEWIFPDVLHWMSSKDLELFTVCRSIIFDVSNPSYCLAFLFLLFLVSFK